MQKEVFVVGKALVISVWRATSATDTVNGGLPVEVGESVLG
jgi:hypothetical protein